MTASTRRRRAPRPRNSRIARTPALVVCSVCITPFGAASVPELKMSSETAAAAGAAPRGWLPVADRRSVVEHALTLVDDEVHDVRRQSWPQAVDHRDVVVPAVLGRGHDDARGRLAEDVLELLRAVVRQQRVEHQSEAERRERDDDRFVAVGQLDRHDVAGAHALLLEIHRERDRVRHDLRARVHAGTREVHHRDVVRLHPRPPSGLGHERRVVPPSGRVLLGAARVRRDDVAQQRVHRPVHRGGRRSRNAWSPSIASSEPVA